VNEALRARGKAKKPPSLTPRSKVLAWKLRRDRQPRDRECRAHSAAQGQSHRKTTAKKSFGNTRKITNIA